MSTTQTSVLVLDEARILIERGVGYATVPRFPWTVVAPLLRVLPTSLLARGTPESDSADR